MCKRLIIFLLGMMTYSVSPSAQNVENDEIQTVKGGYFISLVAEEWVPADMPADVAQSILYEYIKFATGAELIATYIAGECPVFHISGSYLSANELCRSIHDHIDDWCMDAYGFGFYANVWCNG